MLCLQVCRSRSRKLRLGSLRQAVVEEEEEEEMDFDLFG